MIFASSCEGHQCFCQSDQAETVERQQMAGAGEFCDLWGGAEVGFVELGDVLGGFRQGKSPQK